MLQFCQCLHWSYPKLPSSIKLLAFLFSSWPLQKLDVQIQARMLELGSLWVRCNWQVFVTLTGLDLLPNWKDVEKHSRKTPWGIIEMIGKKSFKLLVMRRVKKKMSWRTLHWKCHFPKWNEPELQPCWDQTRPIWIWFFTH